MNHLRSGSRTRMAALASALRESRLDDVAFENAAAIVDALAGRRVAVRSILFTASNVERLNQTARQMMMRDVRRGLLLARLASAIVPRVACRSRAAAAQMKRLKAEALYLCAAAHLRARQCGEAKIAAERAMRAYRAKGVARETRKDQAIVDLAYGQIVFLRGEPERGLRIVAATALEFLEKCGDKRLHSIALITYGSMLMMQRRYRRALRAFDEAMLHAVEAQDQIQIASILHNVSYCAVEVGLTGALPCRNISRERMQQFELNSEVPKSRYVTSALLKREGKIKEAVSELYMIRQEFLDRGMPVVAAQTVVHIVEELAGLRRFSEAHYIGDDALRTLTAADVEFDAATLRSLLAKCR